MDEQHTAPDSPYGSFTTEDGSFVVYDRHEPEAWIQSSVSVRLCEDCPDEQTA